MKTADLLTHSPERYVWCGQEKDTQDKSKEHEGIILLTLAYLCAILGVPLWLNRK